MRSSDISSVVKEVDDFAILRGVDLVDGYFLESVSMSHGPGRGIIEGREEFIGGDLEETHLCP